MNTIIDEIEHIKEMIPYLSETAVHELRTFTDYLADREKRCKTLEENVLASETAPSIKFKSVEDAVKAVFDES